MSCGDADLDRDQDVDARDWAIFQACMSGPGIAPPPGCGSSSPNPGDFTIHGRPVDILSDGHALQYIRARYYDPLHGRWLQRDPSGYTDGANLYEAFGSNALRLVDPSGLAAELHYEGALKWEEKTGKTGTVTIRVYNDGGVWGRSRDIATIEFPVREDRFRQRPRTRAWIRIGERSYFVDLWALEAWLEGLDAEFKTTVIGGDPSSAYVALRLAESFTAHLDGHVHAILDHSTGNYLPGFEPDEPDNIVQRRRTLSRGLDQAARMTADGMRQVTAGFLVAAGASVVNGLYAIRQGDHVVPAAMRGSQTSGSGPRTGPVAGQQPKRPPNPYGRYGGPQHQAKVAERGAELETQGQFRKELCQLERASGIPISLRRIHQEDHTTKT